RDGIRACHVTGVQTCALPISMVGTFELQPPGRKMPRFGRVTIRFGKPLDFSRYAGMEGKRAVLRAVTDEIIHEILQLSGQEYVEDRKSVVQGTRDNETGHAME